MGFKVQVPTSCRADVLDSLAKPAFKNIIMNNMDNINEDIGVIE